MVRGIAYYQIVEGIRTGTRVRQQIVLSLGREPDPQVVLEEWQQLLAELEERREAAAEEAEREQLRAERERSQGGLGLPLEWGKWCPAGRELARTEEQIAKLARRVEMLVGLIQAGKISAAPHHTGGRA
jgi:hypothetical protein